MECKPEAELQLYVHVVLKKGTITVVVTVQYFGCIHLSNSFFNPSRRIAHYTTKFMYLARLSEVLLLPFEQCAHPLK